MNPTLSATASRAGVVDVRQPHYQELKERLHRALLNRLNLDRLNRVGREQAEPEIRSLIIGLLDAETQTRSAQPRSSAKRIITDVFHELFGLGPLETLLADPTISDILVNRANQIYVEREGKLEATDLVFKDDAHLLRIIERIVSSVGRRIDESSPMVDARLAGRLACQRDHSAAGARRSGALDPPVPHRSPRRAATWWSGSR